MSAAFVNTLFTQTVNFAADDFGISDTGIGVAGAVVLIGQQVPAEQQLAEVKQFPEPPSVTGTPGGSRIITIVMQTILNALDHEMSVSAVVNAPRVHHQHLPGNVGSGRTRQEANSSSHILRSTEPPERDTLGETLPRLGVRTD